MSRRLAFEKGSARASLGPATQVLVACRCGSSAAVSPKLVGCVRCPGCGAIKRKVR